ncbi:MAG TPA: DUF1501 domain-containing protein [Gemmataceae bacterium]|jgi:hypothetical protein|nr:DUF1501 domain-containing protein [Gemmataceae bacterium]
MLTRREYLHRVGTGLGVLGLANVLSDNKLLASAAPTPVSPLAPKAPHFPAKAKRIIHLFMNGGPSQVDTFDPKPALARYNGQRPPASNLRTERGTAGLMKSPFRFDRCGQSGLEISEIFPRLQGQADELCVIRSMHTNVPNHEPSLLMMNSGEMQPIRPSYGSWLLYGLGTENQNLPGFVTMCPGFPVVGPQLWSNSFLPGIYQGTHINNSNFDPRRVLANINNGYLPPAEQREQVALLQRFNRMHLEARGADNPLEARIQSMEMAFRMQFEAQDVFDLARETQSTRNLYGSSAFGNACLVGRRLLERGVRVVQIYTGDGQPWDDHGDIANHRNNARTVDQPIAALLADLRQRGLLEDTLVLWGGEFGRTPSSEGAKGRDHNNHGFTVWLAGGGVKGGMAYGSSDEFGFSAQDKAMHVHDLHATMLYLMGIDHERLTYRYSGRDYRLTDVSGVVNRDIIA